MEFKKVNKDKFLEATPSYHYCILKGRFPINLYNHIIGYYWKFLPVNTVVKFVEFIFFNAILERI
jgi:hypothetical protein